MLHYFQCLFNNNGNLSSVSNVDWWNVFSYKFHSAKTCIFELHKWFWMISSIQRFWLRLDDYLAKTIYVRYRLLYFLRQYSCLNVFIFSIFRLDQLHSQYIIWLNYVGPNTWHYLHVLLFLIKLGVTDTQRYNTSTLRHLFMLYFLTRVR